MGGSANQSTMAAQGASNVAVPSVPSANIFAPAQRPTYSTPAPAAPTAPAGASVFDRSSGAYNAAVTAAKNAARFNFSPVQSFGGGGGSAAPVQSKYEVTPLEAQKLSEVNYAQYMSPYTQEVIERGQADIGRERESALNALGAQASAAGAFGGSRFGLSEGETYGQYGRTAADFAAQQRQQAFQQAQQAAQFDIGSQYEAQKQTELMRQTAAENAANRAQSAASAGAGRAGAMALANQQAQMDAAKLRLSAASQLGGLAQTGMGLGQSAQQAIGQQGQFQRGLQQQMIDAQRAQMMGAMGAPTQGLNTLTQTLGSIPYGQTTTSSQSPGIFDYLSLGAMAFGRSDIRLKENIKPLGTEGGINVYSWDWNEDGKRVADPAQPTVGVMAQELQETHPHLVQLGPDGFLRVDYKGLAAEMGSA